MTYAYRKQLETFRAEVEASIKALLVKHKLRKHTFNEEEVYVIWYDRNGEARECVLLGVAILGEKIIYQVRTTDTDEEVRLDEYSYGAQDPRFLVDTLSELEYDLENP